MTPVEPSSAERPPPHRVVVVGGANSDYLVRGPRLPRPGETLAGDLFVESPGGKGANQAVGVARLGQRVALLARLGKDARGERLRADLAREGVDLRHVSEDAERPTGAALIAVDRSGEKQIIVAPGANGALGETHVDEAKQCIALARVVVAGLEVPLAAAAAALRLGKAAGARTILDPAPARLLSEDVLRLVDVIRPNTAEAEELTDIRVTDADSAAHCARVLLARGVGAVILQAGEAGNLVVTPEEQQLIPRLDVESVDATGAGDAFVAGLAAALAEGRTLLDAASFGSAAAAFSTTRFGAQAGLPRHDDMLPLIGRRLEIFSSGSGQ